LIGVIIATHGKLAEQFVKLAEMIIGPQQDLEPVCFLPGEGYNCLEEKIEKALQKIGSGKDVLFLVDLFGGSCFNLCHLKFQKQEQVKIICGVNLPMVLEICLSRKSKGLEDLAKIALEKGRGGIR
jgi:PTS system mannose-specific IIA component/PTS system mannose-specific IIB component